MPRWRALGCAIGGRSPQAGMISASTAYMADGGRYRRRRFAAFRASSAGIVRKPHQPHYQSRDYNQLNGGIERWFEPVTEAVARHPALTAVLQVSQALFDRMTPAAVRPAAWHVELHQFRIEARPGEAGRPTPEGMHRDGVDWVLVLMVRRENIASGETTIYDLVKCPLGSFTLTAPLEFSAGRRQPGLSWRYCGNSDRSAASGLSRRLGRDFPAGIAEPVACSTQYCRTGRHSPVRSRARPRLLEDHTRG